MASAVTAARPGGVRLVLWCLVALLHVAATVGDPVASRAEEARRLYEKGDYEGALRLYRDAQVERPQLLRVRKSVVLVVHR